MSNSLFSKTFIHSLSSQFILLKRNDTVLKNLSIINMILLKSMLIINNIKIKLIMIMLNNQFNK